MIVHISQTDGGVSSWFGGSNGHVVTGVQYAVTALHVLSFGIATGGYLALAWSPFLLLQRVRAVFHAGPTTNWWENYLLVAIVLGVGHVCLGLGLWMVDVGFTPIEILFLSAVTVALAGMTTAGVILPGYGVRWMPEGQATPTAFALLGGAVWYVAITIVPPFVLWTMVLARGGAG